MEGLGRKERSAVRVVLSWCLEWIRASRWADVIPRDVCSWGSVGTAWTAFDEQRDFVAAGRRSPRSRISGGMAIAPECALCLGLLQNRVVSLGALSSSESWALRQPISVQLTWKAGVGFRSE